MPIYFNNNKIDGVVVGTASSSTAGATLTNASDLRAGLIAYGRYGQVTGTMQDLAATTYTPGTTNQTIAAGKYIAGTQTILGDSDLVAGNIKSGVTIFGVTGSYAGSTASLQTKSVTPTKSNQTITPDSGYSGLSSVTVNAIPSQYITTTDANAVADNILNGKTAYVNGVKITGTMRNNTGVSETLSVNGSYTIPEGYHDGTGTVTQNITTKAAATITPTTSDITIGAGQYLTGAQTVKGDADLVAGNIKSGVNIFGVTGTYSGSGGTTINNQNKTVTPTTSQQSITADSGYTGLGTVTVNAIQTETKSATPGASAQTVTPSSGKYLTSVSVAGDSDLVAGNIKSGINIFGVTGTYTGAGVTLQSKTVTPTKSQQTVSPDTGYDALSQVTVNAIPAAYITTSDATATAAQILATKTAYINGSKVTGTMANNGATGGTISTQGGTYTIPAGYTSGGTVTASLPTGSTTAANISGTAFEETTGDYGFRTSVQIQPGYYASATTITKDFSSMLPAPETEGTSAQVLVGYDLYNHDGELISGTMANNSIGTITLDQTTTSYTIPAGYHNGTGKVQHTTVNIPDPTITVNSSGLIIASGSWTRGFTTDNSYSNTYQLTTKTSSDLTVSGATVTAPAGYYASSASKSVASGSAGTPIATKGAVSNHSVSVTPSVTNTTGYITGGTKTGTAVTVNASELVSGSETKTENGTYDVTNLAELVVNVQGGGESGVQVETVWQESSTSSSVVFSNLKGNPTSFIISIDGGGTTPTATPMTDAIVFDGTNLHAQTIVSGTNAVVYDDTSYSKSYSNGTLTITSASKAFDTSHGYAMTYSYGGSASNIGTKDVQVGSGATSITFTGLPHEPLYWSCIFKSNFSTSSGYQRVIFIQKAGSTVYGHCMDSATRESVSYWTASYSGGNLTITSNGTNNGGYFHQPGYYQLTYAIDDSAPSYQTKTVTPTTSQQIITADNGYDALSQVTVNAIPNTYVQPTATRGATTYTPGTSNQTIASGTYLTGTQTIAGDADLIASNIKSGVNIFGVAGTYSGLDTSDATATASDIVSGKTAYVNGREVEGSLVVQTYYTGSTTPGSSLGINGDIYLQS